MEGGIFMGLVEGKYALVTGGASGIGYKTAETFAREGATGILIADQNEPGGMRAAERLSAEFPGCKFLFAKTDVTSEEDVKRTFDMALNCFDRLDILVNCAGVCRVVSIEDLSGAEFERTLAINLKGTFLCSKLALVQMKKQKSGRIINLTSQAGKAGGITVGVDYASSKGAVITLTKSFAKALAPFEVTVNSVAPGLVDTEMTKSFGYDPKTVPLGRIGTPGEVADCILFLASHMARYVTGACIDVNGGISMW